jgi:hypothetical protein
LVDMVDEIRHRSNNCYFADSLNQPLVLVQPTAWLFDDC